MVGALVVFTLTYLVIASRQLHWIATLDLALAFAILSAERAAGLLQLLGLS